MKKRGGSSFLFLKAPLLKVQVAAGHADLRTTERYWHPQPTLDDNAVDYGKL